MSFTRLTWRTVWTTNYCLFTYHREESGRPSGPNTPGSAWTEARELVEPAFVPVVGLGVAAAVGGKRQRLVQPPFVLALAPVLALPFGVVLEAGLGGSCRVAPWVGPVAVGGMVRPWGELLRIVLVWPWLFLESNDSE